MLELTIAFLNSFRKYNPAIPLCLIPYNDDCDRITALKDRYRFDIFNDTALLQRFDDISLLFHEGLPQGAYRKLAIWEGAFDEFIYIDVDTVVLEDVSFSFEFLHDHDCITGTSDMPGLKRWVWKESVAQTGLLNEEQVNFAANTGFITSKKGFLTEKTITGSLNAALAAKEHMALDCQEQAFLNYLMVTSGKSYTSLYVLARTEKKRMVMYECWGGTQGGRFRKGKMYFKNLHRPIFLVHWAGVWRLEENMPNRRLWQYYRYMKDPFTSATWKNRWLGILHLRAYSLFRRN